MMFSHPSPTVLLFIIPLISGVLGKISTLTNQISLQSTLSYLPLDRTICRTIPGLTKSQVELCYQQPDTTRAALIGLQQSVQECQHQFQTHRWNCSSLTTKARNPYTSAIFQRGYRESAFAYALSSAGVAISVAKVCSQGRLMNCGCDPHKYKIKGGRSTTSMSSWKWAGCSHNLQYGIKFSKKFLDSRETATDIQSKINLHNNQVGRMAVANNMQVKCKCHGMSGSCELKTCWRTTPDFRQIGKVLKERFRSAVLVDLSNLGNRTPKKFNQFRSRKRRKPRTRIKEWVPHKKQKRDLAYDLLYYQRSPNFCEKDTTIDVQGTHGRVCNRTSTNGDSCDSLCCGRGYNLQRRRRTERCRCKFLWCCTVECEMCSVEEWISVCK